MSRLEQIYLDFSESEEYQRMVEIKCVKDDYEAFDMKLQSLSLEPKVQDNLLTLAVALGASYEQQGFEMGYRLAVQTMFDVFAGKAVLA